MNGRPTESVLRELARDLHPVRLVPRLRTAVAGVALLWLLAVGVTWALAGAIPGLGPAQLWLTPAFPTVLLGLALGAAGGTLAALAGAVPGRGVVARAGMRAGLAGLALAAAGGAFAALGRGAPALAEDLASSLPCALTALALGIAPAIGIWTFAARGAARRPRAGAAWGALGAVALGALVVHATCRAEGPLHVLLGHALVPPLAALLLALPAGAAIRRLAASGARSSPA